MGYFQSIKSTRSNSSGKRQKSAKVSTSGKKSRQEETPLRVTRSNRSTEPSSVLTTLETLTLLEPQELLNRTSTMQNQGMDIDQANPGPSRGQRPSLPVHQILTFGNQTPRFTEIGPIAGKPNSGFHTSPSFSQQLFHNLVTPNIMYRGFLLTRTSANFPKVMFQTGAYLAGAVVSIGFAKLKIPQASTVDDIKLRIIGEVTAINLAPELILPTPQADALFLEIMNFILHSDPGVFRGGLEYTSDEFVTACADPGNIDIHPIDRRFKSPLPWSHEIQLDQGSITDATRICLWLTTKLSNNYKNCKAELSFSYLIAICRRGSATTQFLTKVSDDLNTELGRIVNFDEDLIRKVYRIYGIFINENNAENVLKNILTWIPEEGLRLRLMLQHAEGSGLTPHYTVKEALLKYPDFPWGRVDGLLSGEIRSFIRAWSVIKGNLYYGFKRDLKEASSQSFKGLAYVAKELLIKAAGKGGLKAYRGWTRTPPSKGLLDEIIENYLNEMGGEEAVLDQNTHDRLSFIANSTR